MNELYDIMDMADREYPVGMPMAVNPARYSELRLARYDDVRIQDAMSYEYDVVKLKWHVCAWWNNRAIFVIPAEPERLGPCPYPEGLDLVRKFGWERAYSFLSEGAGI